MVGRNEKKKAKKKNGVDTEMGYCPFKHKVGLSTGRAGVRSRDTRRRAARVRRAHHMREARGRQAWGTHGTGVGCPRGARVARALGTRAGCRSAAWACCWAVGYALGAFSLFLTRFDSVLFMS